MDEMKNNHVTVSDYSMKFGDKTIIDRLSFDVQRGEIFGFLGSNGSGKTTTLRTLLGIYRPTSGTLLIDGETYQTGHKTRLGYLPEERGLYKKESVIDTMVYFGVLKGMKRSVATVWSHDYLARVGLADKHSTKLDKLSGGQQQKVQLGVTIMNDPELLILDEPTKGLDPVNRRLLMDMVDEQNKKGTTIMLVTHQMEEVERLCERVIMLKDGKRAAYGTTDSVRSTFGRDVIVVRHTGKLPAESPHYSLSKHSSHYAELLPTRDATPKQILAYLLKHDVDIQLFEVRKPSLDDVFIKIYGETPDEAKEPRRA